MKYKNLYSIKGYAMVVAKDETNRTVTLKNMADMQEVTLTEDQLLDQAEVIAQKTNKTGTTGTVENPVEFVADENEASNQSVNTVVDINDTKLVQEDADKAKELGKNEAANNLLKNLGCK